MQKKENQWSLDRAYNFSEENEERTRVLLECIKSVKDGLLNKEEAINIAVEKGFITKRGIEAYERSTATVLRSMGLVGQNEYETTEIADAFVDKEISYKEMVLLQLIKKEFKYDDDSEVIHPFVVTLKTLLSLYKKDVEQAWIDSFDYLFFLTELKSMNDLDEMVDDIIKSRKEARINDKYEKIHDFDMWTSAFVTTGLIEKIPHDDSLSKEHYRYKLNEEEIGLIEWLVDEDQVNSLEVIGEYTKKRRDRTEILNKFGRIDNGIVKRIPSIKTDGEYNLNNLQMNYGQVLKHYLFKGSSFKEIEKNLFDIEDSKAQGFFSRFILESFGVSDTYNKGLWKNFYNYPNLVRLALRDSKESKLYKALFIEKFDELDAYRSAALYLKKYANEHNLDIHSRDEDIKQWRNQFKNKFSPKILSEMDDKSLLESLFSTAAQTNDSLFYWLDKDKDNGLFGGHVLNNVKDMGVAQIIKTKEWSVRRNPATYEEALQEGIKVKEKLIKSAQIVERMQLNSISDYEKLDKELRKTLGDYYYDRHWVRKYLSILYPNKIAGVFKDETVEHVLNCLKIKVRSKEKLFVKNGQISLICNHNNWNYRNFAIAFNHHFGWDTLKIYKVGDNITEDDDFTKQTGAWDESPYLAVGWNNVGDLSKYKKIQEEICDNYNKLGFCVDIKANIRSRQAGQIETFYKMTKLGNGYKPLAVVAHGSHLKYLVDNLQKYKFYDEKDAHRIGGEVHYCFLEDDVLENLNPYEKRATCIEITQEENINKILDFYYYHLEEYENRKSFYDWLKNRPDINNEQAVYILKVLSNIKFSEYIIEKSIFAYTRIKKIKNELYICQEEISAGIEEKVNREKIAALKLYLKFLNKKEKRIMMDIKYYKELNVKTKQNRIVFGAPGTGKSHEIEENRKEIKGAEYERVTFHPDYTYAQFVGTYKPYMDGDEIQYKFVPGPFMRVLAKALKNINSEEETKPFILIVEEINRANVAAVFGDVFQLLDRTQKGDSEYSIETSEEMRDYLSEEFEEFNADPRSFCNIKIPNNMFIWATMNSADQGVFPMDTAFKRRWDFEYLDINNNQEKIDISVTVKGQDINWNELRRSINERLVSLGINEDKLIGPFFINRETLENKELFDQAFKDKLLMYLFEDAAKQKRDELFNTDISENGQMLFSEICEYYNNNGIKVFHSDISDKLTDN